MKTIYETKSPFGSRQFYSSLKKAISAMTTSLQAWGATVIVQENGICTIWLTGSNKTNEKAVATIERQLLH